MSDHSEEPTRALHRIYSNNASQMGAYAARLIPYHSAVLAVQQDSSSAGNPYCLETP